MKLWGVYHADGGLLGELRYVVGKLRGTVHCGLCDITHGTSVRQKGDWREFEDRLDVPIELVHLNEQPSRLEAFTRGSTPCVVGESDSGLEMLLRPEQLDECAGSVEAFQRAIEAALPST